MAQESGFNLTDPRRKDTIKRLGRSDDPEALRAAVQEAQRLADEERRRAYAAGELKNPTGETYLSRRYSEYRNIAQQRLNTVTAANRAGVPISEVVSARSKSVARSRADVQLAAGTAPSQLRQAERFKVAQRSEARRQANQESLNELQSRRELRETREANQEAYFQYARDRAAFYGRDRYTTAYYTGGAPALTPDVAPSEPQQEGFFSRYVVTPYRSANAVLYEGVFKQSPEQAARGERNVKGITGFFVGRDRSDAIYDSSLRTSAAGFLARSTVERPVGFFGDVVLTASLGKVIGATAGAGYQAGSFGGTSAVAKLGGALGATVASAPVLYGAGVGYRYVANLPVRQDLAATSSIPRADFDAAVTEGFQNTGFAGELFTGFGRRERFEEGFRSSLNARGYDVSDSTVALAYRSRDAAIRTEGLQLFASGAVANIIGARTSAGSLARFGASSSYWTNFGRGFYDIGVAGASEGFTSSLGQNIARGERFQLGRASFSAGVGFVSAGALGGAIQGASYTARPKTRRTFEAVGYVLDPSEVGSDYITNIGGSPYGSFFKGAGAGNPIVAATPVPLSWSSNPQSSPRFGSGRRASSFPRAPSTTSDPFVASDPLPMINPLVDPSTDPFPAPRPAPRSSSNPFVPSQPNPLVPPQTNPSPRSNPNPLVNPSPRSNPNPFVPVNPNPLVNSRIPFFPLGEGKGRFTSGFSFAKRSRSPVARYTPSFAALELGIGSSSPRTTGSFTGFEIRPFLTSGGRKKKKGRKTRTKRKAARKPLFALSIGGSPI